MKALHARPWALEEEPSVKYYAAHVRAYVCVCMSLCVCTGGLLLLETFHPDQIAKGYRAKSGGPPDPDMMYTIDELRGYLQGGEVRLCPMLCTNLCVFMNMCGEVTRACYVLF